MNFQIHIALPVVYLPELDLVRYYRFRFPVIDERDAEPASAVAFFFGQSGKIGIGFDDQVAYR